MKSKNRRGSQKAIGGVQSLIILFVLAAIAFYSAYNYRAHVQELNLMEERMKEMQTSQELMLKLMEIRFTEEELEELRGTTELEEEYNQ